MQIIQGWQMLASSLKNTSRQVLSVGAFDGVHRGHVAILTELTIRAKTLGLPSVVLTFTLPPRVFFKQRQNESYHAELLTTTREKLRHFAKLGIDKVVIVPFDENLAACEAQDYLENILIKNFSPAEIILGHDHEFGNNRAGNADLLRAHAKHFNYTVWEVPDTMYKGEKISSSRVRVALLSQDLSTANALLGYPYEYEGVVVEGNKVGRTIGFRTANVQTHEKEKLRPPNGVYAVEVLVDGYAPVFTGMMNIGFRPTMNESKAPIVEVHIIGFNEDIYGVGVRVRVRKFLRSEVKFSNKEELIAQLTHDKKEVMHYFTMQGILHEAIALKDRFFHWAEDSTL